MYGWLNREGEVDLAAEPVGADDESEIGEEDLDRNGQVRREILREVHGRHPAASNLAIDDVTSLDGSLQSPDRRRLHGDPPFANPCVYVMLCVLNHSASEERRRERRRGGRRRRSLRGPEVRSNLPVGRGDCVARFAGSQ